MKVVWKISFSVRRRRVLRVSDVICSSRFVTTLSFEPDGILTLKY